MGIFQYLEIVIIVRTSRSPDWYGTIYKLQSAIALGGATHHDPIYAHRSLPNGYTTRRVSAQAHPPDLQSRWRRHYDHSWHRNCLFRYAAAPPIRFLCPRRDLARAWDVGALGRHPRTRAASAGLPRRVDLHRARRHRGCALGGYHRSDAADHQALYQRRVYRHHPYLYGAAGWPARSEI